MVFLADLVYLLVFGAFRLEGPMFPLKVAAEAEEVVAAEVVKLVAEVLAMARDFHMWGSCRK